MALCWNCGHAMETRDDWQGRYCACSACGVDLTAPLFAEGNAWALQKCRDIADLRKRLAVAERERDAIIGAALYKVMDSEFPWRWHLGRSGWHIARTRDEAIAAVRKAAGLEG